METIQRRVSTTVTRTSIMVSMQTKRKLNSLKAQLEKAIGRSISDEDVLKILMVTKDFERAIIDLTLQGWHTPLISIGDTKMNQTKNSTHVNDAKAYNHTNPHNSHRLFLNKTNHRRESFSEPWRCWKCNSSLSYRKRSNGLTGLYCRKCRRYRRLKVEVPVEARGVCRWSRVDVRESGRQKRRVMLDEDV